MTVASDARPRDLPQRIGRYRIIERVGKGAMGLVYAAEDEAMGRPVAVKVMMADLEEEPETRERFYREARVTGQLVHRNIVTVFDLGEDHGRPYIVMELLSGVPLGDYLATPAALPLDVRVDLMAQVCEGLQVAHDRGIVHRDIKPSNLFIQQDGALKILDFGVARLATSNLTASGFLVGTPDYMSPEQAAGLQVDARSDIFSAAAVFYFMLAGRAPFAASDLPRVLQGVMHHDPPPLSDAEAPASLRRVLTKALEKDPAKRYQRCSDMLADLDRLRRTQDGESHRVAQAALDRYRQLLSVIEERRRLGRELAIPDIDQTCDAAAARIAARFPMFAKHADPSALMEPLDRSVANTALTALQSRYQAELGTLAALQSQAADAIKRATGRHAGDLTLHQPEQNVTAPPDTQSLWARAAAWWKRGLLS